MANTYKEAQTSDDPKFWKDSSEERSFYKRINTIALTKKERLVAQHLLDNRPKSGFMTASGIARDLNISDVTVIRFARKLGYEGFADLQVALQQEVVDKLTRSDERVVIPQERLNMAMEDSHGQTLLQLAVQGLIDNVSVLTEKNSDDIFRRAASIIFRSRRKVVAGFRGCSAVADSFASRLSYMLDDVQCVTHMDPGSYSPVFSLTSEDCLIVIGFERYQKILVDLISLAHKHEVNVIVITDKETSPLAFRSSVCIYCSIKGISFNSFSVPMLATEVISANLVQLLGQSGETRNAELLDYMNTTGYYWNRASD